MPDYLCFGSYDVQAAGHPERYFRERYTWLDFRGGLKIDPTAAFGFGCRIMTASHEIGRGTFTGVMVDRPVTVEHDTWIASFAILYNCTIGHHAIVSIGAVVASMTVEPYTIVSGNPARPVARWNGEKWEKL